MSSRSSRAPPQRGNTRNTRSRKNVLDVDLNALPREFCYQEGGTAHAISQDVPGGSTQPTLIDVEAFDDDVFISSPRAFLEAKNNSRRNHANVVVVDVDSEERTAVDVGQKRRKLRNNGELYINLEGSSNNVIVDQPPPPPPPPKEMTFKCPVCLGQLVDATSTKCGHIFCKGCLKTALAAQSKCPTCRKRSVLKDTIRIFLPASD